MKNIILFTAFLLSVCTSFAQVRTTTRTTITQGSFLDFPGSLSSLNPAASQMDTLQVSDTVAYILPITHTNNIDVYSEWYWQKNGAGTATMTISFLQSNSPFGPFTACLKGVAQSAYTKTATLSASGWQTPISFANDTVRVEGRYLKVQYMTSSTVSVGGKVFTRLKTNVK